MPDRYSRRILQHLSDSRYRPQGLRDLARELGVEPESFTLFETAVRELVQEGHVLLGSAGTVSLPPPGREMTGTFRLASRGFGFIVPDSPTEHGDLFVPPPNTNGAMTGDRVRAKVIHESRRAGADRSPYIGLVQEIIQRADRHYVGNLVQREGRWLVEVDGKIIPQPVVIRDPHAKNAKQGDKVVVELIEYPSEDAPAEGVILEVLGERGEPEVETRAVMRAFGLPERFEPAVLENARQAALTFNDKTVPPGREDLTGTFICTIDPPDAKDYDDAISIRKLDGSDGDHAAWELGVHIADVSTFVTVGSPLDVEAKKRGNSTYLPRRVIPMLPEVLSNGVCSLQEGVNRFVKSAFIRYDAQGQVLSARFANGVIRSAKRLTYREAQALIEDDIKEARKHAKGEARYPSELIHTLKLMDELARVIRTRRFAAGMITLELPEVELVFDDSGRVVDAEPEDNAFTHKIIEMFMVEANEAAARLFDSLDVPMIRRIHPDPPAHDVSDLRQFARVAGFNIPAHPSRRELQQLLDSVRGRPQQQAVHLAVLQTLSKAEYSPLLIGHFALASEHYTHFTSPIRRYADLIVHRALDAYLQAAGDGRGGKRKHKLGKELRDDPRVPDEKALYEIGKHCSGTERNSEAAEKSLRTHLVLELLTSHLGDDFEGTVTGVTPSGVFVQINRYLVDGFIHITDLPGRKAGDLWRLNRLTGALVAQRSGKTITIGDRFVVRIASVDSGSRRLDLALVEQISGGRKPAEARPPLPRKQPKGAAKAHHQTMNFKRMKRKKHRF